MYTSTKVTMGAASMVAGLAGGAVVLPDFDALQAPVEIQSIVYDVAADRVAYTRTVHSSVPIFSAWSGVVIEKATEATVDECTASGFADYGPQEPTTQFFALDAFMTPGCLAALLPGVEYELIGNVTPTNGLGSQARTTFSLP